MFSWSGDGNYSNCLDPSRCNLVKGKQFMISTDKLCHVRHIANYEEMLVEWSNFLIYYGIRFHTWMGMESDCLGGADAGEVNGFQSQEWGKRSDLCPLTVYQSCCVIGLLYFYIKKKILLCKKFVEAIVQCQSFLVQRQVGKNKSIQIETEGIPYKSSTFLPKLLGICILL